MQIIVCLFIIIVVVANPASTGNGLEGLIGSSSDKKNKNGRLRKKDKNFLMIIFIFFSISLGFSVFSQNLNPTNTVDDINEVKYVERLIDSNLEFDEIIKTKPLKIKNEIIDYELEDIKKNEGDN